MKIFVNEIVLKYNGKKTAGAVQNCYKPEADVLLCNGAPVKADHVIKADDHLILIKRGEIPTKTDLEILMRSRNPRIFNSAIKGRTIGIAGVGGLGSVVAVALARSFVKKLILVDFDVVEPSNLNRQQYFTDQLGFPKVEALKANLLRINPYLEIECVNQHITAENTVAIFRDADIVAECFDCAEAKAMIVQQVLSNLTCKIVAASGVAGFSDLEALKYRKLSSRFYLIGDGESAAVPGQGLTAAKVGIAANMQAAKIIELLIEDYDDNKS